MCSGKIMLHKGQLDIFLTAILVLLVRFCAHVKDDALDFESRRPVPEWNTEISDLSNQDRSPK